MHYKIQCTYCDIIISQCRCPSTIKSTTFELCKDCKELERMAGYDLHKLHHIHSIDTLRDGGSLVVRFEDSPYTEKNGLVFYFDRKIGTTTPNQWVDSKWSPVNESTARILKNAIQKYIDYKQYEIRDILS